MLKVAPKSAQNPLGKSGAQAIAIQKRRQAVRITIPGIPTRDAYSFYALAAVIVVFYLVKATLLSVYGTEGYAARIELLKNGTVVEQVGGRLLAIDPVTAGLSKIVTRVN